MSNNQVTVTALLKVKPGLEAQFLEEFQHIIQATHSEEGCINYDIHQSFENSSWFLLHENWVHQEALDYHLEQPYIKNLLGKAADFLTEPPEVKLWQKIDH